MPKSNPKPEPNEYVTNILNGYDHDVAIDDLVSVIDELARMGVFPANSVTEVVKESGEDNYVAIMLRTSDLPTLNRTVTIFKAMGYGQD